MDVFKTKIAGINCFLELGSFSQNDIENRLIQPQRFLNPNQSIEFLAKTLIGTPSIYESSLKNLPHDFMRIRFSSFDCVTFIYTILALCGTSNFAEFVEKLYMIRYVTNQDKFVDNNEVNGNFLHFVCDSILVNAINRNFLKNITQDIIGKEHLNEAAIFLKGFHRNGKYDQERIFIKPEYGERLTRELFINSSSIDKINYNAINSGDILLFTRGNLLPNGDPATVLIGHLGILIKENNKLYMIHATRNGFWKPQATKENPLKISTGYYYLQDPRMEQIGVGYPAKYISEINPTEIGEEKIFYYSPDEKLELKDYAVNYFQGVAIFRPN